MDGAPLINSATYDAIKADAVAETVTVDFLDDLIRYIDISQAALSELAGIVAAQRDKKQLAENARLKLEKMSPEERQALSQQLQAVRGNGIATGEQVGTPGA